MIFTDAEILELIISVLIFRILSVPIDQNHFRVKQGRHEGKIENQFQAVKLLLKLCQHGSRGIKGVDAEQKVVFPKSYVSKVANMLVCLNMCLDT